MREGSDRKKTGNAVFLRPADPVTRNPGQGTARRKGHRYPAKPDNGDKHGKTAGFLFRKHLNFLKINNIYKNNRPNVFYETEGRFLICYHGGNDVNL